MMWCVKSVRLWSLILLVPIFVTAAETGPKVTGPERWLCRDIWIRSRKPIDLPDTGRRLVCGDPANSSWDDIPRNQALFTLRALLQEQGYPLPEVHASAGKVTVDVGEPVRVTALETPGMLAEIDVSRLRGLVGEVIRPAHLDTIKARLSEVLKSNGYPCPEVELRAFVPGGLVRAEVKPGKRATFGGVSRELVPGVDPVAFSRYDAFYSGELFNADWLTLTTRRLLADRVVQSAYFTTGCDSDQVDPKQSFVPGPARQVSLSVGLNTETGPIGRASWRGSRVGPMASSIETILSASLREQRWSIESRWFFSPRLPRLHFRPRFTIRRADERHYENLGGAIESLLGRSWEGNGLIGELLVGPSYQYIYTIRGDAPRDSGFLALTLDAGLRDREYEFYQSSPRTGHSLRLLATYAQQGAGSAFTALAVRLTGEAHRNIGSFNPPILILSARGGIGTTLTGEPATSGGRLALTPFRHFLGGSTDLRGFARQELPGPRGALTVAFLGLEARLPSLLPHGIQPLAFIDTGALGATPATLASPLLLSPGIGVRWESPFAVVRGTFARGMAVGAGSAQTPSHWQFYFSIGEEF